MRKKILYLLRLALFWFVFFQLSRLSFILYNTEKFEGIRLGAVLASFWHAIPLDISALCYLLSIPFLYSLLSNYISLDKSTVVVSSYNNVLFCLVSTLHLSDLVLYRQWGYKLNAYALSFAKHPREVMASASSTHYILLLLALLLFCAVGIIILQKLIHLHHYVFKNSNMKNGKQHLQAIWQSLLLLFLLFLGIRGGLGVVPINQSSAFFSGVSVLNHTAVNSSWNLMYSFFNSGAMVQQNPYRYMPLPEATEKLNELYVEKDTSASVLNQPQPNVFIIFLESWTADVIEKLGGEKGLTNGFNQLCRDGLFFDHIYANGDRTDKGLVAVLSAYPAQTVSSIISQPEKFEKLPAISRNFIEKGYESIFYYGGESEFANMKAYLYHCGFQQIVDKHAFNAADMNSKWGAHDGVVFNKMLQEMPKLKEPFFAGMLTLSSHEPFEVPVKTVIQGKDEINQFRNAIHYSDECLFHFIQEARRQSWYKNTLFVLVADHGHRLPKNYLDLSVPGKFRIPMLWLGGALKNEYRGKVITKTGNQTDIGKSLLRQCGLDTKAYIWSKDLLNENSSDFAYYAFNDGFGWIQRGESLVFDNISKKITFPYQADFADSTHKKIKYGQAYLQLFYEDYLSK